MIDFLRAGLLDLPWWGYVVFTLIVTHITIASVTLYLHRSQAHRGIDLHPAVSHFFRLWLWLTTGMITREWVAVHRRHHATCESPDDPHSPYVFGIRRVLLEGAELYREAARNQELLSRYDHGVPRDWVELHLYEGRPYTGLWIMLGIDVALLGLPGLTVFAVQMMWIPVFAAGVINGLGHWSGYRNYETPDGSTNIVPWAFFIGGEELHNNHHAYPSSAKFALRRFEFDLGWCYIRALSALNLARVKRVAPCPVIDPDKKAIDVDTVKAVIISRMHLLEHYARRVTLPVHKQLMAAAEGPQRRLLKNARRVLVREESRMDATSRGRLRAVLDDNAVLNTVYEFRRRLQDIWEGAGASQDKLLQALQDWCVQAEASGIQSLEEFAKRLRGYSLRPARV